MAFVKFYKIRQWLASVCQITVCAFYVSQILSEKEKENTGHLIQLEMIYLPLKGFCSQV